MRDPPFLWAITPNRNDCANKERGGLQEPCLGPKPPVNETSQGERASRVSGGGLKGPQNSWRPAIPRLFTRRQRKDFAPCSEVKLKVSWGSGKGIYEVRRQRFDSCLLALLQRWVASDPEPSWREYPPDEARFQPASGANPGFQASRGLLGDDAHAVTWVTEWVGKREDSDCYLLGSHKNPKPPTSLPNSFQLRCTQTSLIDGQTLPETPWQLWQVSYL